MKKVYYVLILIACMLYTVFYANQTNFFEAYFAPRIFCIIFTHQGNLKTKARAVYETWARKCDAYKFVLTMPDKNPANASQTKSRSEQGEYEYEHEQMNILHPPNITTDTYKKLTDKLYATFKYLYTREWSEFDWYLKADDDTYIFVDNLRKFLSDKSPMSPVTYGYDYHCYVSHGYHSGGAGYVLSKEAFSRISSSLVQNYTYCPNTGIEDTDVAWCLRSLGVYPNRSIDNFGRESIYMHLYDKIYNDGVLIS